MAVTEATRTHPAEPAMLPTYQLVGEAIQAANGNAAIRAYLKTAGEKNGLFVATPARSFTEIEVKVETVTTVKLG